MKRSSKILVVAAVLASPSFGCRDSNSRVSERQTEATLVNNLLAADKLDGSEDHNIAKCYSCNLEMDGAPDVTSKYREYTLHHCSQACKERFDEKADSIVGETKIPESKSK